ncbi:MAG: aldehyde ferredoxin oxidoreductase family protein [Chloroflexota bacterium]
MAELADGYTGKVLRVDLSAETVRDEYTDRTWRRRWVGGSGFGAALLYSEVAPGTAWDDPENRLTIASGPLAGTAVMGSGTFSAVAKGPLTKGATTTQANGFLGAYLKFSGYDAVVLEGVAKRWLYLHLHDGQAELRDASRLVGRDTWEVQDDLLAELGKKERELSVFSIGPAGENLVRYAAIVGDRGHVAGHNGIGAVMGSKRLKAIVAERGRSRLAVHDPAGLRQAADLIIEQIQTHPSSAGTYRWGTSTSYATGHTQGWLPVRNYSTNIFPEYRDFVGENYRPRFELKRAPCFACRTRHLHLVKILNGPYAGFEGEEPEYEQFAAWGSLVGQTDVPAAIVISNEVDRLGMETNEAGWAVAWALECYERGLLKPADTDGLELTWGNVEAIRTLLQRIAHRQGDFAQLLGEGVRAAAIALGQGSESLAIYTNKGTTPRTHDHRARWIELADTLISSTGTMEVGQPTFIEELGAPARWDGYAAKDVSLVMAKTNGRMLFEDCLGTCRFTTKTLLANVVNAINAATGWNMDNDEAMQAGRRIANLLRAFNVRHGIDARGEQASDRYWSAPLDGPAAGKSFAESWPELQSRFYEQMGWDLQSGRPLPATLRAVGLSEVVDDLWE